MSSQAGDNESMDIDDQQSSNPIAATATPGGGGLFNTASTSSPLAFPSSSIANPSSDQDQLPAPRSVQQLRSSGIRSNGASSSPLNYPSSSSASIGANLFRAALPQSGQSNRSQQQSQREIRNDSPLFFPASEGSPTPKRNRRGDIHSGAPPTTPSYRRNKNNASGERDLAEGAYPTSSAASGGMNGGGNGGDPSSSAAGGGDRDDDEEEDDEDNVGPVTVVWGTTVTLQSSMSAFRWFLEEFRAEDRQMFDLRRMEEAEENNNSEEKDNIEFGHGKERPEKKMYQFYLERMRETGQTNLNLDVLDLKAFRSSIYLEGERLTKKDKEYKQLYNNLMRYPQEIIPILDQVLKDCAVDWAENNLGGVANRADNLIRAENMLASSFKVRPFGGERKVNMRELNPQDIDKIVCIKGLVIRATPIIPDMKLAFFRCLSCSHTVTVELDRGQIAEPDKCPRDVCSLQGSMSLIHNRCEFADRQIVRLQETPDSVPDGQTPHTVSLCLYDELVDVVKPGDRISLTGIFRSVPVRLNPKQRVIKALFKTYLDVVHIKKTDTKRMGVDESTRLANDRRGVVGVGGEENAEGDEEFDEMDIDGEIITREATAQAKIKEKMMELSQRPDIYEQLARSLAPSLWEMDDVKKGILLQLFGGTNKSISKGGGGGGPRYRGDINVLLVGDPGTSKSQILQYVHKIAPRGVYTSGKGSSAVGLTAYVTRDPDSKQLVLESGALVLSDGGVCCIDEFDKMSEATRSVLHEVMEQQTISIAKAGIITTLNARTSILAAANPVGSKYNLAWPVTRNIDLPPTLISRFDLLYLVLDKIDEEGDKRLARHLVSLYLEDRPNTGGTDIMKIDDLSAYISWARNHIHPVLTEEASNELVRAYVEMRNLGADARSNDRRITATTRQLESMIRLSEAHARMRYSLHVEKEDVVEGNRLIREALKESATDINTGLIDLDLLMTGKTAQDRTLSAALKREILKSLESFKSSTTIKSFTVAFNKNSSVPIIGSKMVEVLIELEIEGKVILGSGKGENRTVIKSGGGN